MNTEQTEPIQIPTEADEVSDRTMRRVKAFAACERILTKLDPEDATIVVRAMTVLHEPPAQ